MRIHVSVAVCVVIVYIGHSCSKDNRDGVIKKKKRINVLN